MLNQFCIVEGGGTEKLGIFLVLSKDLAKGGRRENKRGEREEENITIFFRVILPHKPSSKFFLFKFNEEGLSKSILENLDTKMTNLKQKDQMHLFFRIQDQKCTFFIN